VVLCALFAPHLFLGKGCEEISTTARLLEIKTTSCLKVWKTSDDRCQKSTYRKKKKQKTCTKYNDLQLLLKPNQAIATGDTVINLKSMQKV